MTTTMQIKQKSKNQTELSQEKIKKLSDQIDQLHLQESRDEKSNTESTLVEEGKAKPQKNIYEVITSLGRLTIEMTRFTGYIIIVVAYSGLLRISDGYLQIGHLTPYVLASIIQSENPTVLHLAKEEGQLEEGQKLTQRVTKEAGCPVFLSLNIDTDDLIKGSGQEQLFQLLKAILRKGVQPSSTE